VLCSGEKDCILPISLLFAAPRAVRPVALLPRKPDRRGAGPFRLCCFSSLRRTASSLAGRNARNAPRPWFAFKKKPSVSSLFGPRAKGGFRADRRSEPARRRGTRLRRAGAVSGHVLPARREPPKTGTRSVNLRCDPLDHPKSSGTFPVTSPSLSPVNPAACIALIKACTGCLPAASMCRPGTRPPALPAIKSTMFSTECV
jgi:hypothetical protein